MTNQEATSGDGWLAHAAALRSLAAALTSNASDADDLVQETWLHALRGGETTARPRSWWSAVLRNVVRDRARERERRKHTEHRAAHPERLPSEVEVLERLEIAQRVAAEVARLAEPYRTAIHLRYFEGLSPEEIAQRSGAPLETVRARLRRGLVQLRERMDRACGGDRSAWSVALAAIALPHRPAALAAAGSSLVSIGGIALSAKIAWSVAAAIVLGVGAYVLWPDREVGSSRVNDALVVAEAPATPALPEEERVAPTMAPDPVRAIVDPPPPSPQPAAVHEDGMLEVRGTVVVVDEGGVEHRSESGTVHAIFGTGERDVQQREIRVADGAWSLTIPKGSFLGFSRLMVRGREALLPQTRPLEPGTDPIELRGQWLKRGRLRVIDAVTKLDLRDIEVRYADGWRANPDWTHPGDSKEPSRVLHFAQSPFDLPERTRMTPYWLHVRGYAWTRVDFDHLLGGERTVELVAPASVSVSIAGAIAPAGAFVRLYASKTVSFGTEASVSVHAQSGGATRIDDLAPGHYLACVEVGEYESLQRLGETPVELVANEIVHATVTIDAGKLDVSMVHLFGTLALPEELDVASTNLTLWREGGGAPRVTLKGSAMSPVAGKERVYDWDAGSVRTGTWGASVQPVMYRQVIRADVPGELHVEIVIPALVTLSIEVSDSVTGAALKPDRIQWSDAAIEGLSQSFKSHVQALGTKGAYRLKAPAGVVKISCVLDGYAPYYEDFDLRGDESSLQIKLRRTSGVHVEVFEGEARLRAGFNFFDGVGCTLIGERRPRGVPGGRDTEFEWTRHLDPGQYVLTFPALDGYEPIEPVTVDVGIGQVVDVAVRVKRKP